MPTLTHALARPFPDARHLAVDIETTGLDHLADDVVAIAISDGAEGIVVDLRFDPRNPNNKPQWQRQVMIRRWLEKHVFDRPCALHNAAFDLGFLRAYYGIEYPRDVWDTMLAEELLVAGLPDQKVALVDVAERRLGLTLDKTLQTSFSTHGPLSDAQVDYALADVTPLLSIVTQQRTELAKEHLGRVWEIEKRVMPVFAEMHRVGLYIDRAILDPLLEATTNQRDALREQLATRLTYHELQRRQAIYDTKVAVRDAWLTAYDAHQQAMEELWQEIVDLGVDGWSFVMAEAWGTKKWLDFTIDPKDGKAKGMKRFVKASMQTWRTEYPRPAAVRFDESPINLNSPPQVLSALSAVGVNLPNLQADTLAVALPEISAATRDDIIIPLMSYRKAEKLVGSFGATLIEKIDSDGRVRGSWRQCGTATGRPTCSTPNLLQIPSDDKRAPLDRRFRRVFRAAAGKHMIVADFSQMELRILAQASGDLTMREAFIAGVDLHSYTAMLMFNVARIADVSAAQRSTAKTINFGIVYGMGILRLRATLAAQGVFYTMTEAKNALALWRATYPRAAAWIEQQGRNALIYGFTAEPLGRRRHFTLTRTQDDGERAAIRRRGANHCVQGCNASITKLAMILIDAALNGRGTIVLQVYDEIVVECDEEVAEMARGLVRTAMETAAATVLHDIPVAVDVVVSRSWSESDTLSE